MYIIRARETSPEAWVRRDEAGLLDPGCGAGAGPAPRARDLDHCMEPCPVSRWARPVADSALPWRAAVPYSQLRDCRGRGSDPPLPAVPGIGSTVMATRLGARPELDRRRIACLAPHCDGSGPRRSPARFATRDRMRFEAKAPKRIAIARQRPGTIKAMIRNKNQSHSERNRCGHSPGSPPGQCIPVPQLSASSWRKYPCPDGAPGATAGGRTLSD